MLRQDVGDSLFLVVHCSEGGYEVQEKVVWGAKDTENVFGDKAFLVLVEPGDEDEPQPEGALVFQHGDELQKFAGAFEDYDIASGVCKYLNGY